jgi:hypothetical protein
MIGRGAWAHPYYPHYVHTQELVSVWGWVVAGACMFAFENVFLVKISYGWLADRNSSVCGVFEHALYSSSPPFLPQRFQKERNCSVISITDGRRPSRLWKASKKAM